MAMNFLTHLLKGNHKGQFIKKFSQKKQNRVQTQNKTLSKKDYQV